jgi:hypothetical protein
MISYVEKGIGQHDAIYAAGHTFVWGAVSTPGMVLVDVSNGATALVDDEAAVQAVMDAYPLSSTQSEVSARIDAHAAALREKVTAGIAPAEMSSWPIKRSEALAYQADPTAVTPFLSAEAAARGVTVDAIAARVAANSTALSALEAAIAGNAGKHRDAIKLLTAFADVLAYDWSTGWPSV